MVFFAYYARMSSLIAWRMQIDDGVTDRYGLVMVEVMLTWDAADVVMFVMI